MTVLTVKQEACTKCGLCEQICPMGVISLESTGPEEIHSERCISCGHCTAICPQGALDNSCSPKVEEALTAVPVVDSQMAEQFLRARRSIRHYQSKPVAQDTIRQVLEVARMAPTGGNTQGVAYHVVSQPQVLSAIVEAVITWMEQELAKGAPSAVYYGGLVKYYRRTGRDLIFRGAPHLIIATANKKMGGLGRDNCHFALAYAELFAPTLGLGSCWAGFFEMCAATGYQPLYDILALPEEHVIGGAIMLGYPRHSFQRLVSRKPLQISWQ